MKILLRKMTDPDREPYSQVFTIKLSKRLHKRLQNAARKQRRSMADIAREAIETCLN